MATVTTHTGKYTPSFSGGVQRTLASKLEDAISIKDLGAIGGENAADSAAIQAAIDAASAAGGRTVLIPPGTFKAEGIVPKPDVTLQGAGSTINGEASVLKTTTGDMFVASAACQNFGLADLRLDSSGAAGNGHLFNIQNAIGYWHVRRCYIFQRALASSILYLRRNVTYPSAQMLFCTFADCKFQHTSGGTATTYAFDMDSTSGAYFQSNSFLNCSYWKGGAADHFINIDFNTTTANTGNVFKTNWLESLNGGWLRAYSAESWVIDNTVHYDAGTIGGHVIHLTRQSARSFSRNNRIVGYNRTQGSLSGGIYDIYLDNNTKYTSISDVDCGSTADASIYLDARFAGRYIRAETISDRITTNLQVDSDSEGLFFNGRNMLEELNGYTSTELGDAADDVNTVGKYPGRPRWNTTTSTYYYATGTGATDDWMDEAGTTITPS